MSARMQFDADAESAFFRRRDELVAEFGEWLPPQAAGQLDPGDLAMLLDWKWGYDDGNLGRWRTRDLDEFLLGWAPRKFMAPADLLASVPVAVTFAMAFLEDRGLLTQDSDPVARLTEHSAGLVEPFLQAMADPANFGMSKSIFSSMGVEDPTGLDRAGLEAIMTEFNAQPMEVRKAVTDRAISGPAMQFPDSVRIGPIRMPSSDAVLASAEAAPVLDVFRKISDYFAQPGKVLTNTGNLKLVDARALTELLETGDVEAPVMHGQVWRKRSASEFVELDHWQWWARQVGVVRTKHNRLVSVAAWRKRLRADPVATLDKAVEVILEYGPVGSYRGSGWAVDEEVDFTSSAILTRLAEHARLEGFEDLSVAVNELLSTVDVTGLFPGRLDRAIDDLLMVFERAGLVTQHDVTRVELRPGMGTERSGGSVAITPFGVHVAVAEARNAGFDVLLVRDPRELDVAELAALTEVPDTAIEPWWDDVVAWLDAQPERAPALAALVTALDPLYLALALEAAPDVLHPSLTKLFRELVTELPSARTERSSITIWWLLMHDPSARAEFSSEQILDSGLILLELLAEGDDDLAVEMLGRERDSSEQVEILTAVAHQGRPRGLILLEAIGRAHPDKAVGKFARKEAFRLRTKLAAR